MGCCIIHGNSSEGHHAVNRNGGGHGTDLSTKPTIDNKTNNEYLNDVNEYDNRQNVLPIQDQSDQNDYVIFDEERKPNIGSKNSAFKQFKSGSI